MTDILLNMNATLDAAPATAAELELIAMLKEQERKSLAWVAEDPQNRGTTLPIYELSFLREQGWTSIAAYNRAQLEAEYWESYKEIHGIRPRWVNFDSLSDERLQQMIQGLDEDRMWREKEREAYVAAQKAEKKALADKLGFSIEKLEAWGVL